jgi:hypothetical protein
VPEGVGVTTEEGDVVGLLVGRGAGVGDIELVGVRREVGLGVIVGSDLVRTGLGEVEGCSVAGLTGTGVFFNGGLTRT